MTEADPLIGTILGHCRLVALIGRGGMGRVYKAHHLALDRVVAVKLVDLNSAMPEALGVTGLEHTLAEARSAAKLEDSRIVAIYEVGEERGIPYIVMQWVDGETLEARVKRNGPLPPPEALEIIRETAAALGAAHKAGLVHRDIKPGNILLDTRGGVKLTDFGIARPAGVASPFPEIVAGSFHFMAPEQAYGGPPDPRSDLYALGTTWYYALTAQLPYPGSVADAIVRHRDEPPPEVRILCPDITERAAHLLCRLMAKRVEDRPPDAAALLQELSSTGMLLDTDLSGSPFMLRAALPRVVSEPSPVVPPEVEPLPSAPLPPSAQAKRGSAPPLPPVPTPPAALGSKKAFVGLLAAFGVVAFGWQWRRAGSEDWAAGAFCLALLPAALTFGDVTRAWRKAISTTACAAALACSLRHAFLGGAEAPALEAAIIGGVGVCALFGSAFLGHWGQDRSEAVWARVLGPAAGLCMLVAALTWSVPENAEWTSALPERAAAWWAALCASGGGWRWLGTAGLGAALGAAMQLKIQAAVAPIDRRINWNK